MCPVQRMFYIFSFRSNRSFILLSSLEAANGSFVRKAWNVNGGHCARDSRFPSSSRCVEEPMPRCTGPRKTSAKHDFLSMSCRAPRRSTGHDMFHVRARGNAPHPRGGVPVGSPAISGLCRASVGQSRFQGKAFGVPVRGNTGYGRRLTCSDASAGPSPSHPCGTT